MQPEKQKIPFILKLKRFKNSKAVRKFNGFISGFFPPAFFKGNVKRLLVFRNDKIGDAMVTLPVLRDIKLNYPGIRIDVIASEKNRFVFESSGIVDNIIELKFAGESTTGFLKIPIIGGFLLFLKFIIIPLLFSSDFRKMLITLRRNRYDAAADLVGLKRNSMVAKFAARFTIGPGRIAAFLFYDYYLESNWVSPSDNDFMTRKIEQALSVPLGFNLHFRSKDLPFIDLLSGSTSHIDSDSYDIIFHLGTAKLRKLEYTKEKKIIEAFSNSKILITDSKDTEEYRNLKEMFSQKNNITFRLFDSLAELASVCSTSKLLFCYDGGQAHYLSQYIRTIAVFGPGSAALWKPYEFGDYIPVKSEANGYKVITSTGRSGHIVIYRSIWCTPCFDTGCKTRPCLNELNEQIIISTVKSALLNSDQC